MLQARMGQPAEGIQDLASAPRLIVVCRDDIGADVELPQPGQLGELSICNSPILLEMIVVSQSLSCQPQDLQLWHSAYGSGFAQAH